MLFTHRGTIDRASQRQERERESPLLRYKTSYRTPSNRRCSPSFRGVGCDCRAPTWTIIVPAWWHLRFCTSFGQMRSCVFTSATKQQTDQQGDQIVITGDEKHEVVSARRRLVRGTFVAPAVLALHSGSALAVASNLRCLANETTQPSPIVSSNTADSFIRVELYCKSNQTKWYLDGSSVYDFASRSGRGSVNTTFLSSRSVWREVTFGSGGTVQLGATLDSKPGGVGLGRKYIALRFAPGATASSPPQIVGVVDGTTQVGSAVSFNCWMSAAG